LPSASELRRQAQALREELVSLEAEAAETRVKRENGTEPQVSPYPLTLLNSSWKIVMEIRGKKSDKNRVAFRLTFSCRFREEDNILDVEANHRFIKRGYTWAPDRDTYDGNEYIAFDVAVEGLSAVPDGKVYLNARIEALEAGEDGETHYRLADGVVTIKEVVEQRSFWGVFNAAGLLAEFKVVGAFAAVPLGGMWGEEAAPHTLE
ncbi:unnamed protein product, partial [Discosporangium mesarthrocarpum]